MWHRSGELLRFVYPAQLLIYFAVNEGQCGGALVFAIYYFLYTTNE